MTDTGGSVPLIQLSLLHFIVLGGHRGHKTMQFARPSELAVVVRRSRTLPIMMPAIVPTTMTCAS